MLEALVLFLCPTACLQLVDKDEMWSRAYILLYLFIYRSGFFISSFAFLDYLFGASDLAFLLLNVVEKSVYSKKNGPT